MPDKFVENPDLVDIQSPALRVFLSFGLGCKKSTTYPVSVISR